MTTEQILKFFKDTAYIRVGGSKEELSCAEYIQNCCAELGFEANFEAFEVNAAEIQTAVLEADGVQIPCKGYLCAGSHEVEAPFYYMPSADAFSLPDCRGKIVMVDSGVGYWLYHDLLENGAVGFITYDGNVNYTDRDIDQKELRIHTLRDQKKIPGVNINAKDAVALIEKGVTTAKITLVQEESKGESRNVVMDIPGDVPETILISGHYDSTSLSQGAYDNMSGVIAMLGIAEYFKNRPHRYGIRFVFCGSEERGLLGSLAYTDAHKEELDKVVLNVNFDMLGCTMGHFASCCTCEMEAISYINYLGKELGYPVRAYQDARSSDSSVFADKGIPAVNFARCAPGHTATIHNSYDTAAVMSPERLIRDTEFACIFIDRMANAYRMPIKRNIPDNMKDRLERYFARKR